MERDTVIYKNEVFHLLAMLESVKWCVSEDALDRLVLPPTGPGHRLSDVSGSVVLSAPSLVGDAYGDLDGEEGVGTGVDSAIFQVPRM